MFSWMTSDTNESVSNAYSCRGALPCYVLIPKEFGGGAIYEDCYEGYGIFGGRDVYALVAQWNRPELCKDENGNWLPDQDIRGIGIDIACYDKDNEALRYPIKIVEHECDYEQAEPSKGCPYQGYFYEDDEDEFDDDDFLIPNEEDDDIY